MYYNSEDIGTLTSYICENYQDNRVEFRKMVREICVYKLTKIQSYMNTGDIADRFYISQILRYFKLSFSYYEGIKKETGYEILKRYLEEDMVIAVFSSRGIKKKLNQYLSLYDKEKTLVYVKKEEKGYCLVIEDKKYFVAAEVLKEIYLYDRNIKISNACFVGKKPVKDHLKSELLKSILYSIKEANADPSDHSSLLKLESINKMYFRWLENESG